MKEILFKILVHHLKLRFHLFKNVSPELQRRLDGGRVLVGNPNGNGRKGFLDECGGNQS